MLDLDSARDAPAPRDAATLVLARDAADAPSTIEVFCVERNKKSRFLGGAIVFPGGRVEDDDRDDAWRARARARDVLDGAERAFRIAACRETLEEAAILVSSSAISDDDVVALRSRLAADPRTLRAFLAERDLALDLDALVAMSRWITPKAESRRFDARFYVARAPEGQRGAHDMTETMASFWSAPREILARFDRSELQLAPPTHRTLQILAEYNNVEALLHAMRAARLDPICPELVQQNGTLALTLPGDREHSIREPRGFSDFGGATRYVLRESHWRAESAP
jgi:8-oxo-dGTP pyrophosphatase MutT (NUDIX family)